MKEAAASLYAGEYYFGLFAAKAHCFFQVARIL